MDEVERLLASLAIPDQFDIMDEADIDRATVQKALDLFHAQTGFVVPDDRRARYRFIRRLNAILLLDDAVRRGDWHNVAHRLPLLAAGCANQPIMGPTGSSG